MDWREAEREYEGEHHRMETLGEMFEESLDRYPDRPAQKYKGGIHDRSLVGVAVDPAPDGEYATLTYEEMGDVVHSLAAGFRKLGLHRGQRVGIFSDTRMEWAQSDFALLAAGGVVTTVYKSSSPAQVRYLLGDAGATGVVVENEELLERVLEVREDVNLRFIISMDDLDDEYAEMDGVYTLADVYEHGSEAYDPDEYDSWLAETDLDDLASLIYTSGTTGRPKGVQLTHRNFRANVNQTLVRYGPKFHDQDVPIVDETSQTISFLPLAHVLERHAGHFFMFLNGACVGYAESPDTLEEDFPKLEPDAAISVPRVYEKLYDGIREQASESAVKERIFEWATDVSRAVYAADSPGVGLRLRAWLADKLVFSQVKEGLGGNIEAFISGGGTLSEDLCALYHGMGLPVYEAYGLTETAPAVSGNPPEEVKIGTIGPLVEDTEIAVDKTVLPEGEFSDTLGDTGELLVRGPQVTDGYWNKPQATDEAFTDELPPGAVVEGSTDGESPGEWFRTGDIVTVRPDGYMVFRERAKQILVLSTGKNVAPAPIEDSFVSHPLVEQCMVIGDQEKFISALVVPNVERLVESAEEEGVSLPADPAAVCDHEWARERVESIVDDVNEDFESHERIKTFRLVPEEFTEENGLLTPTLKKRRRDILDRYEDRIEEMYAEAEAPTQ